MRAAAETETTSLTRQMSSNPKIRLRLLDPSLALNSPATESHPGCEGESVCLEYTFETLRQDEEFIVYRGHHRRQTDGSPPSVLAKTPVLEHPPLASLTRLEHEYSLRAELDPRWAVQPLALALHEGRTMLVLTGPGGEPLERLLGKPTELTRFLRLAVGVSAVLRQMHGHGLIHKDLKPANILVHSPSGEAWLTG